MIAVLAGCALLSGCGSRVGSSEGAGSSGHAVLPLAHPPASRPPRGVHLAITLDKTTVRAGQPIRGIAVVTNGTGRRITIPDCNGAWLQVGLTNASVHYDPGWLACLSLPGTILRVGTTRLRIVVSTRYNACTNDAPTATHYLPACLRVRHGSPLPTLPRGVYVTKAAILQPKGVRIPSPAPVLVTLT